MSSILFDPATSSGNQAGSRKTSNAAANVAGGLSFDSFLAKNQSRYETSTALRSERNDNDRGYDKDRDYKADRAEERSRETESARPTDSRDDDYSHWDEDDDLGVEASKREAEAHDAEDETTDAGVAAGNGVATQTEDTAGASEETAAATNGTEGAAAANSGTAANTTSNTAAGTASASAAGNQAHAQAAQAAQAAASGTANTAAAQQQAANANAANQNQAGKGTAAKNNATTASVSNNALVSQSNAALANGSAVVTLQSVDPKTGMPAGQTPGSDPAVTASADGKPEAAPNQKPANATASNAQAGQQANTAAQAAAGQAAGANPGMPQTAATTPTALPSAADAPAGVNAPQTAGSSGAPAFTSLTPVGGVTQTANATGAGAAASGNASAAAATPSDQVAVEIRKGVAAGKDSVTIKLNPAELGKIDVKMEISEDGTLRATIAVEKSETLDMLQKDARGLERALQNAGLQADSGSLNFSLRGEGNNHANEFDTASNAGSGSEDVGDDTASGDQATEIETNGRSSHDGALDISV